MSSTTDLDRLIAAWLGDGPTTAPEQTVLQGLASADLVRQRGTTAPWARLGSVDVGLNPVAMAIMAIALVVITTAIGVRTGLIPVPAPNADRDSSPRPTVPADELRIFNAVDGSFQIELSSAWTDDFGRLVSTTYLRRDVSGPDSVRVSVRGADEDGALLTCDEPAGPWEVCEPVTATTLDQLAAAIGLTSTSEGGVAPAGPSRTTSEVDGEPARLEHIEAYEYPARGAEFVTYVAVVHDSRPYLLRFWTASEGGLDEAIHEVLAGFSFVDSASEALRPFTNLDDGYELRLPAAWARAPEEVEFRDGQAATTFGQGRGAGTSGRPALTIIVGNPDGSITPCLICHQVVVTSLSDLEDVVESTPSFLTGGPPERHVNVSLGEQPARSEWAGIGSSCLGCPGAYYHVYAIRNGRPYVLIFDYWTVRFESLALPDGSEEIFPASTLEAILDSFVFLDETDSTTSPLPSDHVSPDGATFTAPDGTFEIALPTGWRRGTGPDPDTLYLSSRYPSLRLSVRAADPEGEIRMCDSPAGPWESCPAVRPSTLEELADAIGLDGTKQHVWIGPIPFDSELDAEPAVTSYLTGGTAPPTAVKYVVAMHNGRPFVIRAVERRSPDNIGDLADLLRGFRFVDATPTEPATGGPATP